MQTPSCTQIEITDRKTMRTERKRRRKILIAIIMITHSRSTKTRRRDNNYKVLNTDSVKNLITSRFEFFFSGKGRPINSGGRTFQSL